MDLATTHPLTAPAPARPVAQGSLRDGIAEIGLALRRPEQLAVRWRDRERPEEIPPGRIIFPLFLGSAVLGLAAYGLTMGMHAGLAGMLLAALKAPFACGTAWAIALPSLYIINSSSGSKLDASTTALAALTTASFGAMAMLAGVPVNWFFTLALPYSAVRYLVNGVVFAGVGVAMADTFLRVMKALEPKRSLFVPAAWLGLLALIGGELMLLVGLFDF
jgi:hypothetical protein